MPATYRYMCVCVLPYFSKVPHIEEVEGVKELAVPQAKFVMTHLEESPDVFQAEELRREEGGREIQGEVFAVCNGSEAGGPLCPP